MLLTTELPDKQRDSIHNELSETVNLKLFCRVYRRERSYFRSSCSNKQVIQTVTGVKVIEKKTRGLGDGDGDRNAGALVRAIWGWTCEGAGMRKINANAVKNEVGKKYFSIYIVSK